MSIYFGTIDTTVVATVKRRPNEMYFFSENGDPDKHILCHLNQGGNDFSLTSGGRLVLLRDRQMKVPSVNTEIVLARMSTDPVDPNYTKARGWIAKSNWDKNIWKLNSNRTYRLVSDDHRTHGLLNDKHREVVTIIEPTCLIDIVAQFPRHPHDPYNGKRYTKKIGPAMTISSRLQWQELQPDGTWLNCADPRPVVS